eukprot:g16691.t1
MKMMKFFQFLPPRFIESDQGLTTRADNINSWSPGVPLGSVLRGGRRESASAAVRDGSASKGQYPPPLRLISKEDADMEFEDTKEVLLETLTGKRAYEREKVHNALAVSVDHIILQTKKFLADPAFHTRTKLAVDVCGGPSFSVIPGPRRRCDYVYVFGDVHGAIDDLIQVLANLPDKSFWTEEGTGQIVFLGDYGDRAPTKGDSWFTLLFMMYLQSTFPDRVLLLRGNHETKVFMGQFMLRPCVPRPTAKPSTSAEKAREAFAASLMFGESGSCPVYDQGDPLVARNLAKVSEAVKKYVLEDSLNRKTGYTDPAWFSLLPQMAVVFDKTLLVHGGVSQDLKSVAELRTVDLRKLSTNKNKARLADRFFDNCAESAINVRGTSKWRKEDIFYGSEELEPLGMVPEIWRELPKTLDRRLRRKMDADKVDELDFWCSNELLMADPSPGVEGLRMLPLIEMTLSLLDVEGLGAASSSASVSAPARTTLQEEELKRAVRGSLRVLSRLQLAIFERTGEPAEQSEVMKRVEEMEQLLAAKVESTTRADLKRKVVDIIDAAFPTEEENEPAVQQDAMMSDLGLRLRLHLRFRVDAAAVERLRTEYKKLDAVLDHLEDYRCPGAFSAEAANAYLEGNGLESIIRGHQPDTTRRNVVNFRYDLFPRLPLISGKGAASKPTAAGGGELKSKVMFVFSSPYYYHRRRTKNPTFGSFVKLQRKRTSSPRNDDDDDDAEKDGPPLKRARMTSPAVPALVEAAFFVDKVAWQKKTTYEDFSEPLHHLQE